MDTASGSFKNQNIGIQIKSALAFPGKSLLDSQEDVIVVAVTNADMDADALAEYYDRRTKRYRISARPPVSRTIAAWEIHAQR